MSTSRDELMKMVREYADAEHPNWSAASVTVSRGVGNDPERLIIVPGSRDLISSSPLPAEFDE